MTEKEWLRWEEPVRMVTHLRFRCGMARTKSGRRKLRLFGCACCRRVAHLFPNELGWPAVEQAERLADGQACQAEVDAALRAAEPILRDGEGDRLWQARLNLHQAVLKVCGPAADAAMACSSVGIALRWLESGEVTECATQAVLLRDVFGNPFRPPATIQPAWLAWNGGAIVQLARTIYENRRFEDMVVLADALEEAGCHDVDLLAHLRDPGPHIRGCWLIDALLAKS